MSPNSPSVEAAERTLAEARKRAVARGELTVGPPENPERRSRRLQYLIGHPDASDDQAAAAVDEQLAQEDEQAAAGKQWVADITDSLAAMTACGCCWVASAFGSPDALCADCRPVVNRVRAERLEAEQVNGHSRRQLAEAWLDRTG
jgi:hypothetical protein